MIEYSASLLFACVIWWFSTGVILYLDGLPKRTYRWTMLASTLVLCAAFVGVVTSRDVTSPFAAYQAFTCGLLIWGWLEMSYYLGFITGTHCHYCPRGLTGWSRFSLALRASLYHELSIVCLGCVLFFICANSVNPVAFWTFAILWSMRWSAKLNIYLGVRNLNADWLPEHLKYLASYFRKRAMNGLFPVSVSAATVVATVLVQHSLQAPPGSYEATAQALLATLLVLAILEHWFLVLPLPADRLWDWGLTSHRNRTIRSERPSRPRNLRTCPAKPFS